MGAFFTIREHQVLAQHIREYEHGVADEDQDYFLHVHQYTPNTDRQPQKDDLTIIAAGGLGLVKEVYEPLFQNIAEQALQHGVHIRNFWISDVGCVGKSALLNANNLGGEQSWFDHSRDLLAITNHFRSQMPRPIVGLGHSMGGCQIAYLSTLHPHLFHSLILIEPAIYKGLTRTVSLAITKAYSRRRQFWTTRADAEKAIRKNPTYKNWHPRTIDILVDNSFVSPEANAAIMVSERELQNAKDSVVTTSPRDMEVHLVAKPNFTSVGSKGLDNMSAEDRTAIPDADPDALYLFPFHRPEPNAMLKLLPTIRPSVCYIIGEASPYSTTENRTAKMENTGVGVGGSGGAALGRVVERVVGNKAGHYLNFEEDFLHVVADHAAAWLGSEMQRWRDERHISLAESRTKLAPEPDRILVESVADWHPKKSPDIEKIVKSKL